MLPKVYIMILLAGPERGPFGSDFRHGQEATRESWVFLWHFGEMWI